MSSDDAFSWMPTPDEALTMRAEGLIGHGIAQGACMVIAANGALGWRIYVEGGLREDGKRVLGEIEEKLRSNPPLRQRVSEVLISWANRRKHGAGGGLVS